MASTEFVAVNWNPDTFIDEDTMNTMVNNMVFLRNQMITGKYLNIQSGAVTTTGIKLMCGRALIAPRNSDTANIRVNFASMFTAGTNPVVTTSITSGNKVQIFHVINGIGKLHPDSNGFEAKVNLFYDNKKKDKIKQTLCVNWIAMGL